MQKHMYINEREIGVVTHYWNHLQVAGVHLSAPVDVGDHIHVVGNTSDLEQDVGSMEIEHNPVVHGNPGDDIGISVSGQVRAHDKVYKMVDMSEIGQDYVIL